MTKPTHNPLPIWSIALPIAAWLVYFIGIKGSVPLQLIGGAMLIGSVLSAVHHAEVVAHKVGEPFGTIILALAITVLEVGLIVSMMMGGGQQRCVFGARYGVCRYHVDFNGIIGRVSANWWPETPRAIFQ